MREPTLAARFRRLLGTDPLTRMEKLMADDFLVLLRNIAENTSSLDATQQAVALNIKNGFTGLETKVADLTRQLAEKDQVTEEMRVLATGINDHMASIKKNVEAMDNGYEPAVEPEDTEDVLAEPNPGVPATPDVPVDGSPVEGR